jgi:hypothetical protein
MVKPQGYDTLPVGFIAIKPGAHSCNILEVKEAISRNGNNILAMYFDTDEKDSQPGYFTEMYKKHKKEYGDEAKWRGVYYITLSGEYATANLKRFTSAVEHSNKGFVTLWDLVPGDGTFVNCFKGKKIGVVFRMEEYTKPDGTVGRSSKPFRVCDYNKVAETKVPSPKTLAPAYTPVPSSDPELAAEGFYQVPEGYESEMPFN